MPQLLGRNAVEYGLAEIISIVHDSWIGKPNLFELESMVKDKKFLTGTNVTFIDFCVYDSLSQYEAELSA